MKILAFDSTAVSASVALAEDDKLIGSFFINNKLTHSKTLVPMAEDLLKKSNVSLKEIDAFAVNSGPGSFTGVRIGVAAVKGLAFALNKPCVAVSTLDSMAYNLKMLDCIAVCVMDARCSQVYNANYCISKGIITKLCDDRAVSIEELTSELTKYDQRLILVGDGAQICFDKMKEVLPKIEMAQENCRYQNAVSTAFIAEEKYKKGDTVSANDLQPYYLRLPQAERELKKRKGSC